MTDLPSGVAARPMTSDDIDAVVNMVNTCERHDSGEVMLERSDLVAEARVESFDGAVAAGFEPARGSPPYTLSRRAPSSARAGHRGRVYRGP